jgi:mono/diheme cytochrome c family protein
MRWYVLLGSLAVVGAIVLVLGIRGTLSPKPPLQIFPDMKLQPIFHAQGENRFFADRRDMRLPVTGTVAYGGRAHTPNAGNPQPDPDLLQADDAYYRGVFRPEVRITQAVGSASTLGQLLGPSLLTAPAAQQFWSGDALVYVSRIPGLQTNPDQPRWRVLDKAFLDRGQEVFNMTCALCHGGSGNGKGVTRNYGMAPANLHDDGIVKMPDGKIYDVLTNGKYVDGKPAMMGYGHMIRPADRWAVVAYVRALQRSQRINAAELKQIDAAEAAKLGVK